MSTICAHLLLLINLPCGRRCSQVPTWRGDVVSDAVRIFSKVSPHPAVINQSIDCPYTCSFNFHSDGTHLAGVCGF